MEGNLASFCHIRFPKFESSHIHAPLGRDEGALKDLNREKKSKVSRIIYHLGRFSDWRKVRRQVVSANMGLGQTISDAWQLKERKRFQFKLRLSFFANCLQYLRGAG